MRVASMSKTCPTSHSLTHCAGTGLAISSPHSHNTQAFARRKRLRQARSHISAKSMSIAQAPSSRNEGAHSTYPSKPRNRSVALDGLGFQILGQAAHHFLFPLAIEPGMILLLAAQ